MKENTEIAVEIVKQVANSPKTSGAIGAVAATTGNFFDSISGTIPSFMFYGGAVLLAVSLYNQLHQTYRLHFKKKSK